MSQDSQERKTRFADLGLSSDLTKVLTRLAFKTPTPIQEKAIPPAIAGRDVIGIAQTGTGKTLAFCLPMLHALKKQRGIGLVIAPTRELAEQVQKEMHRVGGSLGFKSTLLIGGANINKQIKALRRKPDIIVATPGRLIDHIDRRNVKLNLVRTLVLDEADRMLDMGFAPQIRQILKAVPKKRQTLLFSATMPKAIAKIAHGYMHNPVRVEAAPSGTTAENVEQGVYYVNASNKFYLLQDLLNKYEGEPVLVFCRTKRKTRKMATVLDREGYRTEELHSNRSQNQRRHALRNFKNGKSRVMVATNVAARGIDVKKIGLVVNYDLPDDNEEYVHRIGRTGRAGHTGRAVSFALPEQYRDVKAIERLVEEKIPVLEGQGTITETAAQRAGRRKPKKRRGRGQRRNRRRGRRSRR